MPAVNRQKSQSLGIQCLISWGRQETAFSRPLKNVFEGSRCKAKTGEPGARGNIEQVAQPVGSRFIRSKYTKISGMPIRLHDIPQETAHDPRRFRSHLPRLRQIDGVIAKIGQA